ncbi:NAD-dependent epimerase/dehydratase family protein [Ilyomonas limi]|uniref:NAD-dependent epimerase/dehydratase family protein n=1 Tax=Ilyomonas limi TaxID=2575867 RepID=A0A4U3L352_9BACT|nr:NAD-dependent epimerase/dehydratase family protein [Ilyomonas limi]TKK69350.1 NAD-dependent epimerase/dehydratase family protein [Ilyomonas limi]
MALHTILGANGTIATELLPILHQNKEHIRLVSRRPQPVSYAQNIAADMLNYDEVISVVRGSDIVYLLVGLEYNYKVWQRDWPVIMRNVINACKAANAKLIFFDNVYPYGIVNGKMNEATPFNPISKKGKIRAEIDMMLLNEMQSGALNAIIARAADFYGPRCTDKSVPNTLVFSRLKKKQTPQWLANAAVPRSLTYTPDAAKAIYILSQHPEAFDQTWMLPTAAPPLTGKQFIQLAARYMHGTNKVQVIPKWVVGFIGLFNPVMKEIHEMMYQDEYGYWLDSSKFEQTFHVKPTPYEEGIKATAEWFLQG